MAYYLGIDGGGTKTKLILCNEKGQIISQVTESTCHYLQCGYDGVRSVLQQGIRKLTEIARISVNQITYAFIGCPGYGDSPRSAPEIRAAVESALSPIPFQIGNDCENALAGGLAGACGINLICGTGSMGCGRNEAGQIMRCGGWHHTIGSDEGSGFWIGLHLLTEFTRQSDGRSPKTPLYDALKVHLALDEDGDIITRVIEEWNMDRTKVAALTRLIPALLEKNDSAVLHILNQAAEELAEIAIALYHRLQFAGDIPVSCTGGVLNLGPTLTDPLKDRLAQHHMRLIAPMFGPDIGALLLAMQANHVDLTPEILQNLSSLNE